MSKVSELTMAKDTVLTGLKKTVELHYKIPDVWNILPLNEEEVVYTAEEMRYVHLLRSNRMAHVLSGTSVPGLVLSESSLLWNIFIPMDIITSQPGEKLAFYRGLGKTCDYRKITTVENNGCLA